MATYESLTDKQKLAFLLQEDKFPYFTDEQLGWLIDLYTIEGVVNIYGAAQHGVRTKSKATKFNIGDISIDNSDKDYWTGLERQFAALEAKEAAEEDNNLGFNLHHVFTPNLIEN